MITKTVEEYVIVIESQDEKKNTLRTVFTFNEDGSVETSHSNAPIEAMELAIQMNNEAGFPVKKGKK